MCTEMSGLSAAGLQAAKETVVMCKASMESLLAINFRLCQPERLIEISRGLSEFASETPGQHPRNERHPEGMQEDFIRSSALLHPFRVRQFFALAARGIASLNPGLISGNPSGCCRRRWRETWNRLRRARLRQIDLEPNEFLPPLVRWELIKPKPKQTNQT